MTSDRSLLVAAAALLNECRAGTSLEDVIEATMAITPRDLGLQWCEVGTGAYPRSDCSRSLPLPGFDDLVLMVTFERRPTERVGVDAYFSCVAALVADRLAANEHSDSSAAGAEEVRALQAEVDRLQGLLQFISGIAEQLAPEQG